MVDHGGAAREEHLVGRAAYEDDPLLGIGLQLLGFGEGRPPQPRGAAQYGGPYIGMPGSARRQLRESRRAEGGARPEAYVDRRVVLKSFHEGSQQRPATKVVVGLGQLLLPRDGHIPERRALLKLRWAVRGQRRHVRTNRNWTWSHGLEGVQQVRLEAAPDAAVAAGGLPHDAAQHWQLRALQLPEQLLPIADPHPVVHATEASWRLPERRARCSRGQEQLQAELHHRDAQTPRKCMCRC
mmetsp:Transcript_27353/g.78806  ORF Transcript_27353/g.78806 Transcript_27353/m.78806 type:complete len:240 (-) Transcript_27353:448-1167(-)